MLVGNNVHMIKQFFSACIPKILENGIMYFFVSQSDALSIELSALGARTTFNSLLFHILIMDTTQVGVYLF